MSWLDIVILAGVLILTALGLKLLQRVVPHPRREEHNDVAGFIFASVGVTYAVLLAFVVIAVWGNNDTARHSTFSEADDLAGVYWISRQMPAPLGPKLERETLDYAHTVIDQEWPLMAKHESSAQATNLVYQMRSDVFAYTPSGEREQVLYEHAVSHVEALASNRRARLNLVDEEVPALLWIALVLGGLVTIGFTFLFGLSNNVAHTVMVLGLTALVVVSLIVIKEMDYPFGGVTRVSPTAFNVFLERLPPPR